MVGRTYRRNRWRHFLYLLSTESESTTRGRWSHKNGFHVTNTLGLGRRWPRWLTPKVEIFCDKRLQCFNNRSYLGKQIFTSKRQCQSLCIQSSPTLVNSHSHQRVITSYPFLPGQSARLATHTTRQSCSDVKDTPEFGNLYGFVSILSVCWTHTPTP